MKKFLLGVLVGVLLVGLTAVIVVFALVRFSQRPPHVADGSTLVLKIEGEMPERPPVEFPFPGLAPPTPVTVHEYWALLNKAAADTRVRAVLLAPEHVQAGWGKLREVRDGLVRFRKSGKPLIAMLKTPGSREYYLATAAERIYISPEDFLDVKGLRAELMYFKNTLDKIGARMELENAGRYKDAGDIFTRTGMSPETREVMNSVMDGIYGELVSAIAEGRKRSAEEIRATIDQGPFLARQAVAKGLVDSLLYDDQVYDDIKNRLKQTSVRKLSYRDYLKVPPEGAAAPGRTRVALLIGEGAIWRGAPADLLGEEEGITPDTFGRTIRQVANDGGIRGVIVRVDSPGGESMASDDILRELRLLSKKKPIVISMSDLAASGGYYIAMTGDTVLAYPNTFTGSIGVIYGKLTLRGLYDKLGIQKEILSRGRFAEIDSDYQPLTEAGRQKLREGVDDVYKTFVQRVAEGRKRKYEEIEPLAQGRVWLGSQAKANGLIDEIGGLERALEIVKTKAQIPAQERVRVEVYPRKKSFIEALMQRSAGSEVQARLRSFLGGFDPRPLRNAGFVSMLPYRISVN
jgi:protease-4